MNQRVKAILTAILFWILFILSLFLFNPVAPIFGTTYSRLMYGTLGVCCALIVTWLFLRYEKRTFRDIGLIMQPATIVRFFKGLAIGSGIFGLILIALLALTPLQLEQNTKPFTSLDLLPYLAFLPLSFMEEIAFRSYPFIRLHQRFGLRVTQVIVAIAFALWHVIGGQSVFSSFMGPGVYALVFGLAAVWSGGIALPFGIHVALNILQPLTGMRENIKSVWALGQEQQIKTGSLVAADTVGLIAQLLIFIAAIFLTELYIRRNGNYLHKQETLHS